MQNRLTTLKLLFLALSTIFFTSSFIAIPEENKLRRKTYIREAPSWDSDETDLQPILQKYKVLGANQIAGEYENELLTFPLVRFLYIENENKMPTEDMLVYKSNIGSNNMICLPTWSEEYFKCLSNNSKIGGFKNVYGLVKVTPPQFAIINYSVHQETKVTDICNNKVYQTFFAESDDLRVEVNSYENIKHLADFDDLALRYNIIFGCDTSKPLRNTYIEGCNFGVGCLPSLHGRTEMPWLKMYSKRLGKFISRDNDGNIEFLSP